MAEDEGGSLFWREVGEGASDGVLCFGGVGWGRWVIGD